MQNHCCWPKHRRTTECHTTLLFDWTIKVYDVWCPLASAATEHRWTISHEVPPQTVHSQFHLPRHGFSLTRGQLLVVIAMGDWMGPIAFFHLTACRVLNSWKVGFLMHFLRCRLGNGSFMLVTTWLQWAALSAIMRANSNSTSSFSSSQYTSITSH